MDMLMKPTDNSCSIIIKRSEGAELNDVERPMGGVLEMTNQKACIWYSFKPAKACWRLKVSEKKYSEIWNGLK